MLTKTSAHKKRTASCLPQWNRSATNFTFLCCLFSVVFFATSSSALKAAAVPQAVSAAGVINSLDAVITPDSAQSGQENESPATQLARAEPVHTDPGNFIADHPYASALATNAIALLAISLGLMTVRYRKSQQARLLIEKAEQRARESEERYRLVTENAADIIWVWEEGKTTLKFCSPAIQRVTGYTVEEYLALPITDMMSHSDFDALLSSLSHRDVPMLTRQIQLKHKHGHLVWVEMAVQGARTLEDGSREWVGVSRDISQRKQNEIERRHLEEQVRQAQKFESLGTLAGGIAHDFNNILTVIMGVTDMLKLEGIEKPSTTHLLERLQQASDKARTLVQQILIFSRQSKGEKTRVDLATLVQDCSKLIAAGKPDNVALTVQLSQEEMYLQANSNLIEQVVVNLASNASEALAGSSGEIILQAYPREITVPTSLSHGQLSPGSYVCIRLQDNGIGMGKSELSKAFDPFYTSKDLGNGLGLAIVYGIVMDHGGAIDIESEISQGTTVTVLLPASVQDSRPGEGEEIIS